MKLDSSSPQQNVQVAIKASKTDPFRKGVTVFLGRTANDLCPGPFFRLASGAPLTREVLVRKMWGALEAGGIDASKYAGHSFRIGAATTAAMVGVEDSLIKTMGRWAYQLYVRVPRYRLASVAQRMSAGGVGH